MRTKRPDKFYHDAWHFFCSDIREIPGYQKAIEAFECAALLNNGVPLSGCMTNKHQALSHMKDDVQYKVARIRQLQ